jgi:hypothetical protein
MGLPLIVEACREDELSYEYRHRVTSYGASTYALSLELRKRKRIRFEGLVKVTEDKLAELGYEQSRRSSARRQSSTPQSRGRTKRPGAAARPASRAPAEKTPVRPVWKNR